MSPHDSLAVHPSERSPTLPSSSGLCVRRRGGQIENEQQSIATVGEVSQPLKVMALASRLAGPDNAVPSLPGSDSWLSKKKQQKKIRSLFLHVLVQSSYIFDVVGTFWMLGSSRAFDFVWLCHGCYVQRQCGNLLKWRRGRKCEHGTMAGYEDIMSNIFASLFLFLPSDSRKTSDCLKFSPLHPYTHRTQRLVWVPWCDSRNRASQYQIEAASWQRRADGMRAE